MLAVWRFFFPILLTVVVYESQRFFASALQGTIHVGEPYAFDWTYFSIPTAKGWLIPSEWWQLHTHPLLDFWCGLAYLGFFPVFIAVAAYYRFVLSRTGTRHCHARTILYRSPQLPWAFFWVNLLGYATYYLYPAAPPWYVAAYGFGPADPLVRANLAGCVRFDALIGLPVFAKMYAQSAQAFGAIPSLHVAYPLIAAYWAFRFGSLRVFNVGFYLLMCLAAVYFNHHYVLDVLLGSLYALVVVFTLDLTWNWKLKREGVLVPGPDLEYSRA